MRLRDCCALACVLVAACGRGDTDTVDARAAAARVGQLLYAENLISDPEVNAKVRRYIAAVDRDAVPPDSVLPELHAWLVDWADRHPDRAARARMMPWTPPPVVKPAGGERNTAHVAESLRVAPLARETLTLCRGD